MNTHSGTFAAVTLLLVVLSPGCGSRGARHGRAPAPTREPGAPIFATAPPGLAASYLGLPLDAHFRTYQGVDGATLFPSGAVNRVAMNQMEHAVVFIDDTVGFAANASAWSFLSAEVASASNYRFATYRAYQIRSVDVLDDRIDSRTAPAGAFFYPSKIYYGHSFEAVLWGSESSFHSGIKAEFSKAGSLGISAFAEREGLDYKFTGMGLTPRTSSAIFAFTQSEVTTSYSTEGPDVPIFVEYRSIPGAEVHRELLPWARSYRVEIVFDKFDVLDDSAMFFKPTWAVGGFCEVNGKRTVVEDRWVLPPGTKVSDSQPAYSSTWSHIFTSVGASDIVTCGVEGAYSNKVGSGAIALSRLPAVAIVPGTETHGVFEGANGSTKYRVSYTARVKENAAP